ncbi:MAG: hypothetical protein PHF31_00540 [Methylobacter sp.]|nr:hypothetical protein [Methylobacter sp.]
MQNAECRMSWSGQEFRTVLETIYLNQHKHKLWLLFMPSKIFWEQRTSIKIKSLLGEGIDVNKFNSAVDSAYLRTRFAIADSDVVNIDMIREDKG